MHLSSKWADDVSGEHSLLDFDNPTEHTVNHRPIIGDRDNVDPFYDHAHFLLPIIFGYQMVQQLGWAEHTSDWDWYVGIQTRDGVWHGDNVLTDPDNEDPPEDSYVDDFSIRFEGETITPMGMPFKTTDFDYGSIEINLEGCKSIALRDIAAVHINQR